MNTQDWQKAKKYKGIYATASDVHTCTIQTEDDKCRKNIEMRPQYKIVCSLSDFFRELKVIHEENKKLSVKNEDEKDLFLYRGQSNINWAYVPTILRSKNGIKRENIIFKEFHRRFYERFDACKTAFEEEVLMQHYGVGARCLDLMENPLVALWAACYDDNEIENEKTFGEVSIWKLNIYSDDIGELKSYDSSTVSVIANTAKQAKKFTLGHIEIEYHKEHPTELQDFIYIKDILRRTAIVRPKYNNNRIRNQQGSLAIVNLNKMVDDDGSFRRKTGVSIETFEKFVLENDEYDKKVNIQRLWDGTVKMPGANFSKITSFDIMFEKKWVEDVSYVDSYCNL